MIEFNFTPPAAKAGGIPWDKLFEFLPELFWPAIALLLLFRVVGIERLRKAFSNLTKITVSGIELEFQAQIEDAATARSQTLGPGVSKQLSDRMARLGPQLATTRVLWIDDNPAGNGRELALLKSLGASIDLASDDAGARLRLGSGVYDIVVSDMDREGDSERGKAFLPEILAAVVPPRVIFFVGTTRDTPAGAFGLTVRPDGLFNLILDAVERGA